MPTVTQTEGVTFQYAEASSEDPAMPMTNVIVLINGKQYDSGTFPGSCQEIGATGGIDGRGLMFNEVAATQCWFGGGGVEIGVFFENGAYVIKKGELGEGSPDAPFFRGNFILWRST